MSVAIGFVLDPIEKLHRKKDSSIAMLIAAQQKGWTVYYWTAADMFIDHNDAKATMQQVTLHPEHLLSSEPWYALGEPTIRSLRDLDVIMMRKDPPFDMAFIHDTYVLDRAVAAGAYVVNPPSVLRDCNEKLFTTWFPECMPPTLITHCRDQVNDFLNHHGDIIVKPPDGMGGAGIFRMQSTGVNNSAILETLLPDARSTIVAQQYIPAVVEGDKRILLIDGEPIDYALARIPAEGETRANLAVGGRGVAQPLTDREKWICEQVKPEIQRRGLLFVGLDVIGGYLTEVNVTSPTGIRELDAAYDTNVGGKLMDAIERHLSTRH